MDVWNAQRWMNMIFAIIGADQTGDVLDQQIILTTESIDKVAESAIMSHNANNTNMMFLQ
jgi:hypothetical protein